MAIRKSGYVALFDVLGFSERVMRGAVDGLDAYIGTVTRIAEPNRDIGTILFSDRVVLFTFDDSDQSFDSMVGVCSNLFHDLVMAGVPVRGAISYGDFVRSAHEAHGTVLAGRPIIEAHHYESRMQWVGIMLAPSVLERRHDISHNASSLAVAVKLPPSEQFVSALSRFVIQPCSSIPLEESSAAGRTGFEGFAIVPISLQSRTLRDIQESVDNVRNRLVRLKQLAPDARSQAKYQRSVDWLRKLRNSFANTFADGI